MKHSMVPALLALVALCSLNACGKDVIAPELPDMTGFWDISFTGTDGSGTSCEWSGGQLNLEQEGATFNGYYGWGSMQCSGDGQTINEAMVGGSVISGAASTNGVVSFWVDSRDNVFKGSLSGDSMSGTYALRYDFGKPFGVMDLSGDWKAARR